MQLLNKEWLKGTEDLLHCNGSPYNAQSSSAKNKVQGTKLSSSRDNL
jgi:hypothetical protein